MYATTELKATVVSRLTNTHLIRDGTQRGGSDTGLFVNVRVMPATLTRLSGSGTHCVSAEFHPASEARLPFSVCPAAQMG